MRIIVTGQIAQYPLGGVAWFYLQYALGLRDLGHEVYYIEDTGQWPYHPQAGGLVADAGFNVAYLANIMARFGLEEHWAYCFPWNSSWFGMQEEQRKDIVDSADVLFDVSGVLHCPWNYRNVRRLAFIDTDPVFTQVKLARGQADFRKIVDTHDVHFTYAENPDHAMPATGHRWLPTRAPVVLSEWQCGLPHREVFTTIMNWTSYNPVTFNGITYGQKDIEFRRFLDLPSLVRPAIIELAVAPGKNEKTPFDLLKHKGWHTVDPNEVCPDLDSLRNYTQSSKAEWSVAKHGYVAGRSGWFSERSARYLASGRPVIVEDTGFTSVLPTGEGILPFATMDDAVKAIRSVEHDYEKHSKAARAIAEEYFDSRKVLARLVLDAVSGA